MDRVVEKGRHSNLKVTPVILKVLPITLKVTPITPKILGNSCCNCT